MYICRHVPVKMILPRDTLQEDLYDEVFMKKISLFLLLVLMISFPLQISAQSSGTAAADQTGEALTWMVDELASLIVKELGGDRPAATLRIGDITYNGGSIVMGEYLAAALPIRLASKRGHSISVASRGPGDFQLTGKVFPIGSNLQLFFSIYSAEGTLVGGKELRIPNNPALAELMEVSRAAAGAGDLYEPDSFNTPQVVQPGSTVSDRTLSEDNDTDWFSFTLGNDARAGVLTVGTESSLDTYIEVYHADDPDFAYIENDDDEGENARVFLDIQPGQTLIVAVRGYDSDVSGPYTLVSTIEEFEDDGMEPNNRKEDATQLQIGGGVLNAKIFPSGDQDWFRVTVPAGTGDGLFLDVPAGGSIDSYMDLYTEDGELLLSDDDGSGDIQARIFYGPVSAGETYYICLKEYENSGTGEYSLSASLTEPVLDAYEPDNSMEEANSIILSPGMEREVHTFTGPGDSDWFTFTIDSAATAVLETEGTADTLIRLYDSSDVIEENDDDGEEYNGRISRYLAPGTYWLEVSQYEESVQSGVEYSLIYGLE